MLWPYKNVPNTYLTYIVAWTVKILLEMTNLKLSDLIEHKLGAIL